MSDNHADHLKNTWVARNKLYKQLFGSLKHSFPHDYLPPQPVIMPDNLKTAGDIAQLLGRQIPENKIPILTYGPEQEAKKNYWTYITSGLSNPWFSSEPDEVAGFGCELMIKTPEESQWAARLLRRLAFYILSYAGTLSPGVMLSLDKALFKDNSSSIAAVLIWYADEAVETVYQLPAGAFGIFSVIGLTVEEQHYIENSGTYSSWCMQEAFRQMGLGQITTYKRQTIIEQPETEQLLAGLQNYCRQFNESGDYSGPS